MKIDLNRIDPVKTLGNMRATKLELYAALAKATGRPLPPFLTMEAAPGLSAFKQAQELFLDEYQRSTGLPYFFSAKDGAALKQVLKQIRHTLWSKNLSASDTDVLLSFEKMVRELPSWYRENQFNLPVMASNYNNIASKITYTDKHGSKGNNGLDNDYKQSLVGDLR